MSDKKTPRYIEIADALRQAIAQGEFPRGTFLPTEEILCERYGVSRYTVREALRRLQSAGIISRRQGSGSMVESASLAARYRQEMGTVDDLLQYASDTRFEMGPPERIEVGPKLAPVLQANRGEHWFHLSGVRTQRHLRRVITLTDVYIPTRFGDCVRALSSENGPVFLQLEELAGIKIERITQEMQAVLIEAHDAKKLDVSPQSAGLRMVRTYYDAKGAAEVAVNLHPGSRYTYHMEIEKQERG